MNPLERAERRRAARQALTAALAGLDTADKQALLEDALADSYAARQAIAQVPGMAAVAVPELSWAKRVVNVVLSDPGRIFAIEEVAATLATGDLQRVRSELARQARQGNEIESAGRGKYRAKAQPIAEEPPPIPPSVPPIPKDEPPPLPPPSRSLFPGLKKMKS